MANPDPILLTMVPAAIAGFWAVVAMMPRRAFCEATALQHARQAGRFDIGLNSKGHAFVGTWATGDGQIRHQLLSDGRYLEWLGRDENAYRGSYTICGDRIHYEDDTGFTGDGEFRDGILFHAGMVLYRA